ncbi:MAG: glycosyltransferase family 4 protein [Candidatus Nomurabacteria bacterium]|nr:glycosyltransferase family 4 protein [Candidatus Nomurabacteria bacterium]
MSIGILLSFKSSMSALKKSGQDNRFVEYYLEKYTQSFGDVYVFSWNKEVYNFQNDKIILVPNKWGVPNFLYIFLMPFIEHRAFRKCSKLRLMQFTSVVTASIVKTLFGVKFIATYGYPYGSFFKIRGYPLKSFMWGAIEKLFINFPDGIIVTYNTMHDHIVSLGMPESRIHEIKNGVDVEIFKPQHKTDKSAGSKTFNILFVGRFEKEKNILNLAKAYTKSRYKKTIQAIFVGRGSLEKELIDVLDDGGVSYKIYPSVPHANLVEFYQSADVYMLPSLREGQPKTLLEAMSCGLPAVVGAYPGHETLVNDGDNAVVCGHSADEVQSALDGLLGDEQTIDIISVQARKYIVENHNIHTLVSREIQIIKSL